MIPPRRHVFVISSFDRFAFFSKEASPSSPGRKIGRASSLAGGDGENNFVRGLTNLNRKECPNLLTLVFQTLSFPHNLLVIFSNQLSFKWDRTNGIVVA